MIRDIENQIEIVNDKMNKNIKGINNKKLIRNNYYKYY